MPVAGCRDHVVVCGWSSTARALVAELGGDGYDRRVVVLHDRAGEPAGAGVHVVHGDVTDVVDLDRAGIRLAEVAVVCPAAPTDEADMRSILTLMAIGSVAPQVRTVVEVNNPAHVDHFRRAGADEVVVTSRLAARLLAGSSLHPGLAEDVIDLMSGSEGSQLHRVALPDDCLGLTVDEVSAHLRRRHRATLVAVGRGGRTHLDPSADFRLRSGDEAIVLARSLGTLVPATSGVAERASVLLPVQGGHRASVPAVTAPADDA